MTYVYGGFLDLLANIFVAIFDNILKPILIDVFEVIVELVMGLIHKYLVKLWLLILSFLLKIVDIVQIIFNIAAGTSNVTYDGNQGAFLNVIMQGSEFRTLHLKLVFAAFILSLAFAVFGAMKVASDAATGGKLTAAKFLKNIFRCGINMLVVPLILIFILDIATATLRVVENAFVTAQFGTTAEVREPSLGTTIFLNGSMTDKSKVANPSITDEVRIKYYNSEQTPDGNYYSYSNTDQVEKDFDLESFDFTSSIVCATLVALIMMANLFVFMRRFFEIIVLYLVVPFTIATMPFDSGALFNEWKGFYFGRVMLTFGPVYAMRLYIMVVGLISNNKLSFGVNTQIGTVSADSLLKLAFIIGGAFAVSTTQHVILSIVSRPLAMGFETSIPGLQNKILGSFKEVFSGGAEEKKDNFNPYDYTKTFPHSQFAQPKAPEPGASGGGGADQGG